MALLRAITPPPTPFEDVVPELVDTQCGYCGRAVSMQRIGPVLESDRNDGRLGTYYFTLHTSYLCPRGECARPSLAFFVVTSTMAGGRHVSEGPRFIPRGQAEPMPDLPDEIQGDRLEAWSCYYGGDLRAAVIMGRAAVQRAVRVLNAQGGGLAAEIDDLEAKRVITTHLKDFAHETRIAGNDAAHPTTLGKVERDEANESLDFMDEFLEHTIALPARREARKLARSAT